MRLFTQNTKVHALSRAPLFEALSRRELVQLARISDDLEVQPGKVLCKEGDVGREFFVIVDGEVEVTREGKRVATGGGGEFFGETRFWRRRRGWQRSPRRHRCAASC